MRVIATESGLLPSPGKASFLFLTYFTGSTGFTFFEVKPTSSNCMGQNQQQGGALPSSQGGLVQYFDADTGFKIDPKTVIMAGGMVAVIELVLQTGILPV
jgi:preprotein translocase subunit Sec61beta